MDLHVGVAVAAAPGSEVAPNAQPSAKVRVVMPAGLCFLPDAAAGYTGIRGIAKPLENTAKSAFLKKMQKVTCFYRSP